MNPARWLGWLLPAEEREFILGDLEEAHGAGLSSRRLIDLLSTAWSLRMLRCSDDIRFAARTLARSPGFTTVALLTLALGIGSTSAIFSVAWPVLFGPLPYPGADRIVTVGERQKDGTESNTGYQTFLDLEQMATTLEGIAVTSEWTPTLQATGESERLQGQRVTRSFFAILGVRPRYGRDFTAAEQVRGQHRVTILSHRLWVRRFGGNPAIVGQPVTFDGIPYTVVGVMPEGFENLLAPSAELWAPLGYEPSLPWACRTCRHLKGLARVKEGVTLAGATRELDVISGRIVAEHPTEYQASGMVVTPLETRLTRAVRPTLLALMGAVGFVLLIACANVSSLLLGRAMQREPEFAIRGALGAGRSRVVRQLLTESVLLAVAGGALGVLLAWWAVRAVVAYGPASLPRLSAIGLHWPVVAFTAGLSILCGLLFGLVPALATARPDLFTVLRPGGRLTGQRSRRHLRSILVAAEVALALMLLVGAGLLLRSLGRLLAVDPGFESDRLLTLEVQTTGPAYQEDAQVRAYFERALTAVRAVPGVEAAGWVSMIPLGGNFDRYGVQVEGRTLANPEDAPAADRFAVWPGYLEAMRIPLRRGRLFDAHDAGNAPPVVVINETMARLGWPDADPIGKRVQMGGADKPWREVVGIVGDVHHTGLDDPPSPQVYVPSVQWHFADGAMALAARTSGDPAARLAAVRSAIRSVDPGLPILRAGTGRDLVDATAHLRRVILVLFQLFAGVAVGLAAAGIYGVLSASVTERTRELGVRSALGAPRHGLVAMVVRQGLLVAGAGALAGLAGALVLTRYLRSLLFGVEAHDPLTFAAVVLLLGAVAVAACWAPAWRATRVSPLEALRAD